MPTNISVENNFIGGLKTEFTGLNFPENACTATQNCVFTLIGDVTRRMGIDLEQNYGLTSIASIINNFSAYNTYKWNNAGGDGLSQIVVVQIGGALAFFLSSAATPAMPLSTQLKFGASLDISQYVPAGSPNNFVTVSQQECQFADGNGFLFVFHPMLDPFFVQFDPGGPAIITGRIFINIRDFLAINPEPGNPAVSLRPTTLTPEHSYNLQNQGWTNNTSWSVSSTTPNIVATGNTATLPVGPHTFQIPGGYTYITNGTAINLAWSVSLQYIATGDGTYTYSATGTSTGTVTGYNSSTGMLSVNIQVSSTVSPGTGSSGIISVSNQSFTIGSSNILNTIGVWNTAIGNYPSNADIWWEFKDTGTLTGENGVPTYNPAVTVGQVPLSTAQAPQGHFILNAFNQDRSAVSGVVGITPLNTYTRPRTGCWFQGRTWFAGADAFQRATGDMAYYTWTENIYFSQIITDVTDTASFGNCYQTNDPTDDRLFNLLPTDGGVILIPGTGPIYKLFPYQNGLFVFAANGIWVIRGNTGLGFTADDFSVNKISSVQSISGTSIIDVLGLPFFWNEEGIYRISVTQGAAPYGFGGFNVEPLTVGTILSFYNNIPFDSKRFARGAYDPITYVISWIYRSTQENPGSNQLKDARYSYDSSLNLNVFNRAFYPYTFPTTFAFIHGLLYVNYPSGVLEPQFKYLVDIAYPSGQDLSFAEERDNVNWVDFYSLGIQASNYTSSFTTGYRVHGQAFRRFQPIYVDMYSNNSLPTQYSIQGIWDYATSGNTGRQSTVQNITNPMSYTMASGIQWPIDIADYAFIRRRHRIPGHGRVMQLNVSSIDGNPFHFIGWAIPETIAVTA